MKIPFRRKSETVASVLDDSYYNFINGTTSQNMSLEAAVGVPAVLAVIRLLAHASAMVEYNVVRGVDRKIRDDASDSWQYKLLNRRPGLPPMTPFQLKADMAANFHGRGEAYLLKTKPSMRLAGRPGVLGFSTRDAAYVIPRRDENGQVVYSDSNFGTMKDYGPEDMMQIRSFSTGGVVNELRGVSPITAARLMISAGNRRLEFEDAHLKNGIHPGMVLEYPAGVEKEQAEVWVQFLEAKLGGPKKAGGLGAIGGGAKLIPMPISLSDALFAEMTHLTLEQAAAMWQVPFRFVMNGTRSPTDDDVRYLATFAIAPLSYAFAEACNADLDMFGPDEQDLSVVPDFTRLMTVDPLKIAQVQHFQVQSGVRLVDELRGESGYGPLPPIPKDWTQHPGQIPQLTPVGGAPNPEVATTNTADDLNAEDPSPVAGATPTAGSKV